MGSVFLGLLTALFWGASDALSRQTGRALGAAGSLFGMMLAGSAGLSLWILISDRPWPGVPSWWTAGAAGLAAFNMLLFYEAMRRGPVSVVAPAVGAYPAWAVLLSAVLGTIPPLPIIAAMATTLVGVFLVARFAVPDPDPEEAPERTTTFALAMIAGVMFAVTLLLSQRAIAEDGLIPALWWCRTVGVLAMIPLLLAAPRPPRPSCSSGALALTQGIFDTAGLVFLFTAGSGLDGALATVTSSAFCVVTVFFARLFYHERVTPWQGAGILAVTAGVVALAALA